VPHLKKCHTTEFEVALEEEYEKKLAATHAWYKRLTNGNVLPLKTVIGLERASARRNIGAICDKTYCPLMKVWNI
jgi:hypothetical protein